MKNIACLITLFLGAIFIKAQSPPVGIINIYGLRTVSEAQIRAALQIKEGDSVTVSSVEIEKRLAGLPNIEQISVSLICCDDLRLQRMLFIGIREKGVEPFVYRSAPPGEIRLPSEINQLNDEFTEAYKKAVIQGDAGEDDSQGHALFKNPEPGQIQKRFIPFANQNLRLLRRVLRESADPEQRALATEIIAYYDNKRFIINDLIYAAGDGDSGVRNNAMRALGVLAGYANDHPDKKIKIPYLPFIKMVNSVSWTDRNKSSLLLMNLSAGRDWRMLESLRTDALVSLFEIARWKNPGHALAGFVILGRIAGLPDAQIWQIWQSGDREALFEKVKTLKSIKKLKM